MPSTATVTQRPRARRAAALPAARSICDISQPPKMSPAGFVSDGIAMVRITASRTVGVGLSTDLTSCVPIDRRDVSNIDTAQTAPPAPEEAGGAAFKSILDRLEAPEPLEEEGGQKGD